MPHSLGSATYSYLNGRSILVLRVSINIGPCPRQGTHEVSSRYIVAKPVGLSNDDIAMNSKGHGTSMDNNIGSKGMRP